ncbi:MAG: HmuY family protein [Kofleriaceae bacterium]
MRYLLLLCAVGCADNISHETTPADASITPGDDSGSGSGSGSGLGSGTPGKASTTRNSDGSYTTIVDATSQTDWTDVDFETGGQVDDSAAWDLRAQRFHISTNNAGGVKVAPLAQTFAATTTAPADGYIQDTDTTTYAFDEGDGWYDYDATTHVLTPKALTYVVITDGGATLKFEIQKYYDAAGTSGVFTWHWAPL